MPVRIALLLALTVGAGCTTAERVPDEAPSPPATRDDDARRTRGAFLNHVRQTAAVTDVRAFGAVADDGDDDAAAFREAFRAAHAQGGGAVFVPAGTYHIGRVVDFAPGVSLVGEGCGASVLKRAAHSREQLMFRVDADSALRVQGVGFDYNHGPEFYRALGFRGQGSTGVSVLDNCFYDTDPDTSGADRWGIEFTTGTPNRDIEVAGNHVTDWIQLTAGSGRGMVGLHITDNTVIEAEQNAISVSQLGEGAVMRDVLIARNVIVDAHAIGINVSPDQPDARGGRIEDVRIVDNVIVGFPRNKYGIGIFVRAAEAGTADVVVEGNTLIGTGSREATGIRFIDDHPGERRFDRVVIRGNHIQDFSRSIWLGPVYGGLVEGNRIVGHRPIERIPRSEVVVRDNDILTPPKKR